MFCFAEDDTVLDSQRHIFFWSLQVAAGESRTLNSEYQTLDTRTSNWDMTGDRTDFRSDIGGQERPSIGQQLPKMTLDQFMARYTSEDNASFREILDRTNRKRMEKSKRLAEPPHPAKRIASGDAALRITDGYGTTGQDNDVLDGWRYEPKNMLMYDGATKDSLPLSVRELKETAGPPKSVNHAATGFIDMESQQQSAASGPLNDSHTPAMGSEGDPYKVLSTPSFDPGEDGTPLMTWGNIEATPLRLEDDNPAQSRRTFTIHETPKREQIAHKLGSRASQTLSKTRGIASSSPAAHLARRASGLQPGSRTPMSPAARMLAASLHAKTKKSSSDRALRASYSRDRTPKHSGWESPG